MHQDLLDIRDLYKVDQEMDALREEARALVKAIDDARKDGDRIGGLLATEREALEAVKTEERRLNRKLEEYSERRDRKRVLIDEGRAPDFLSAQRQYEQCAAIADETESALLEVMEQRETVEERIASLEAELDGARHGAQNARANQSERRPHIEARFHELEPLRAERWKALPSYYQTPYIDLRRRGRTVLANIVDGSCSECRMRVAPQVAIEVARGDRAHACRGCGRYLYDVKGEE